MSNLPQQVGQTDTDSWGEPISVYTDAGALEDGVLADLRQFPLVYFRGLPVNRMTGHLGFVRGSHSHAAPDLSS